MRVAKTFKSCKKKLQKSFCPSAATQIGLCITRSPKQSPKGVQEGPGAIHSVHTQKRSLRFKQVLIAAWKLDFEPQTWLFPSSFKAVLWKWGWALAALQHCSIACAGCRLPCDKAWRSGAIFAPLREPRGEAWQCCKSKSVKSQSQRAKHLQFNPASRVRVTTCLPLSPHISMVEGLSWKTVKVNSGRLFGSLASHSPVNTKNSSCTSIQKNSATLELQKTGETTQNETGELSSALIMISPGHTACPKWQWWNYCLF